MSAASPRAVSGGRELARGAVGRFWTLGGERLTLDADGFRSFDRPGYAKVVLAAGGGSGGYSMSGTLALA